MVRPIIRPDPSIFEYEVPAAGDIAIGRDLHLSPRRDATRVFRLCWQQHHGCYDQDYISTLELLRAERFGLRTSGGRNRIHATLL
jgi:hypothetical protein